MLVFSVAGCSEISVGKSLGYPIQNIKGITPGIFPDIVEKDLEGKEQWLVYQLWKIESYSLIYSLNKY